MNGTIAVTCSGLVTSVGNDTASTCAAIRCAIDNIQETAFADSAGELIIAAIAELDDFNPGEQRLVTLATSAIQQVLDADTSIVTERTPLLLCLAEDDRHDRAIADNDVFMASLQKSLNCQFSDQSTILTHGHVAAAVALRGARTLLNNNQALEHVIIASADSLISEDLLKFLEDNDRLVTSEHSDGFIPGEAGAALVIKRSSGKAGEMGCKGLGFAVEPAPILSEEPTRADGLTNAIKAALDDAQSTMQEMAYRITDLSGEHYYFKEAALALSRTLHAQRDEFDLLHPADCVGDTGTTLGLIILAYQHAQFGAEPPQFPSVLAHMGDDNGNRAAIVLG